MRESFARHGTSLTKNQARVPLTSRGPCEPSCRIGCGLNKAIALLLESRVELGDALNSLLNRAVLRAPVIERRAAARVWVSSFGSTREKASQD